MLLAGQEQCGEPPNIEVGEAVAVAALVKLELLTVLYKCPEGQQLAGPAKRTCGEEGEWMPGVEERTSCHQE